MECVDDCVGPIRGRDATGRCFDGSGPGRASGRKASLLEVEVVVVAETVEADREWPNLLEAVNKSVTALRWRTWPLSDSPLVGILVTC